MYITVDELIAAFSRKTLTQLSNDDPQAVTLDDAVLARAIKTATERIDAALRSRYQLPLTATPTVLSNHCLYLARHWLYARRPEMKMPETVKDTYQQAIKELEQIALGKLHLGITPLTPDTKDDMLKDSGEYRVKAPPRLNTDGY